MRVFASLFFLISAIFVAAPTSRALAETPHEVVTTSSEKVLSALKVFQKTPDAQPEVFGATLLALIDPVVDFSSITDAVISQYKKDVTVEQRERFIKIFKTTMTELYAKALLKFEIAKIDVLPQDETQPFKGIVNMQVTSKDGHLYKITYAMRADDSGRWQVRNVLLDGINLGLTYRNQFSSAMNRYNGDVEQVINSWATEMSSSTEASN